MTKKQLLQRIKSLEEYFGLVFVKPEEKYDDGRHLINYIHGKAAKLDELISKTK